MDVHADALSRRSTQPACDSARRSDAPLTWRRALAGAVLMLVVDAVNVGISELVKYQSSGDGKYDAPYLTVYTNHLVTGVACLLCGAAMMRWQRRGAAAELRALFGSVRRAAVVALGLGVLYKYNVCWAAAVAVTEVNIFMSISQSYCVLVFLLSACFLGERATLGKCTALLLCTAGVVLVALAPGDDGSGSSGSGSGDTSTSFAGIVLTLGFTFGQAVFQVLWGVYLPDADATLVILFLGIMLTSSAMLCWPPLPILAATGVEALPRPTSRQLLLIGGVAVSAVANNFTLMFAVSVTTPLFVSVGLVLSIPLAAATDRVLYGDVPAPLAVGGMLAIVAGFLLLAWDKRRASAAQARLLDGDSDDGTPRSAAFDGTQVKSLPADGDTCPRPLLNGESHDCGDSSTVGVP